ncbi:hypothetical protein D1007_36636 [Hordeum vulgare]|nr:hypothetical protein D1007_36636 [Hordeum vulgare]
MEQGSASRAGAWFAQEQGDADGAEEQWAVPAWCACSLLPPGDHGRDGARRDVRRVEHGVGTAGGQRFDNAVGLAYSKQVLSDASTFIWNTFNQRAAADRKPVDAVTLVVEDIGGVAFASGNGIHLSAKYVGGYSATSRRR